MENEDTRTIGQLLRAEREKKGLTLAQVNEGTKISPVVLKALEEDDHSSFPSETYLKGFLKSYAGFLDLDGRMLWRSLRGRQGEAGGGDETFWDIEAPIREEKLTTPRIFRRFVVPVLVLIIVVLTILLIREYRTVRRLTEDTAAAHVVGEVCADARRV